jgi:hypothetical protein
MSDTTIKNMFYVVIAILTIYPVIELFFKKHNWLVRALILIFIIFFWFVSCNYQTITDKEAGEAKHTSDSLNNEIKKRDSLIIIKTDSTNLFLTRLNKIGIKDSSNYPVVNQTINATFNRARDVYFGGK